MGSLANFIENEMLDHIFKVGSYSPPATVYVGLSTADPGDDGGGLAEPSGNNYTRKAITFAAASSRAIAQTGVVTFNQATGSWGTISHWALFDASTSGNMMAHGSFAASKTIASGNTPSIASGGIVITVSAGGFFTSYVNSILDWLFRAQTLTVPTNIYVAASTTAPNDTGNVTEPGAGAYARVQMNTWATASGGATSNSAAITFPEATASWGSIVGLALYDAITSGTPIAYGSITSTAIDTGDTLEVPTGDYDVTAD